jgi:hypothetical protein
MKNCKKCNNILDLINFRLDNKYKDGLFCWCKFCEKKYQILNKEKHKLSVKKYAKNNLEKRKNSKKKLQEKYKNLKKPHILTKKCSKCKIVKNSVDFTNQKTNKDGLNYYCRECCKNHKRSYYLKNKQKVLSLSRTLHLNRKKRTPKWANLKTIYEFYKNRPIGYHVDHIIPLNGENVCGLHVENNLQYLPINENLAKSNKWELINNV